LVEPKSSLSLLCVIGLGEHPIVTEEEKNFFVTLPRHCLLLSLLCRRRSLLVIRCQIDLQFLFNWLFIHLKSGYSTIPSRI